MSHQVVVWFLRPKSLFFSFATVAGNLCQFSSLPPSSPYPNFGPFSPHSGFQLTVFMIIIPSCTIPNFKNQPTFRELNMAKNSAFSVEDWGCVGGPGRVALSNNFGTDEDVVWLFDWLLLIEDGGAAVVRAVFGLGCWWGDDWVFSWAAGRTGILWLWRLTSFTGKPLDCRVKKICFKRGNIVEPISKHNFHPSPYKKQRTLHRLFQNPHDGTMCIMNNEI